MVIAVLSGLLMFIGLLLIVANLVYVGYAWEKGYNLFCCSTCDEVDYVFYSVFYSVISTLCIIGVFMLPQVNLLIVPALVSLVLLITGMIGLVKLGGKLAHMKFSISTKKEDE